MSGKEAIARAAYPIFGHEVIEAVIVLRGLSIYYENVKPIEALY